MAQIQNADQFVKQVNELLENNEFKKEFEKLIKKGYNSGAIDTSDLDTKDFSTAKMVACVVLKEMSRQYTPFNGQLLKEAQNLELFI